MPDVVLSVSGVPIRLTDERWAHIRDGHEELRFAHQEVLRVGQSPTVVLEGRNGEFLAVQPYGPRWIVVAYREVSGSDGFIITAVIARRDPSLNRVVTWPLP